MTTYLKVAVSKVNGNGHRGHPNDRQLRRELAQLIADFLAAEELRRQQLREITKLRRDVYAAARRQGVSAAALRAMASFPKEKAVTGMPQREGRAPWPPL